jgi:hypothetical protein
MLSIIIPSFNTQDLLEVCLNSIVKFTKNCQYEIIIIDNASSYDVQKQINNFKIKTKTRVILIKNSSNLGFAKACNQGIKTSCGEFILFLNSDTKLVDNSLQKSLNFLNNNQNFDILGCQLLNSNKTIQPSAGFFPKLRQIFLMMFFIDDIPLINRLINPYHQNRISFYKKTQKVDWVTGAFLFARADVLKKINGFDEDYFMYAEEVDLCFRAKKSGFEVVYYPGAKIIHLKEASPREFSQKAVIAEFKGLKLFFSKNKPGWEMPFLRLFLKIGSLLRVLFFGILLANAKTKQIYLQAFAVA